MKILLSEMERYNAAEGMLETFKNMNLDGLEFSEFLKKQPPVVMAHFIRTFFSLDKEELKSYFDYCNVTNSTNVWYSTDVDHCSSVAYSKNVIDSSYVYSCKDVKNGKDIYDSLRVEDSENVSNCKDIIYSQNVVNSHDVECSSEIFGSSEIDWSKNILRSDGITDSQYIYHSHNMGNSYFCGFSKNSDHCLFCMGVEGAQYMIFNQPVEVAEFEEWCEKLLFMLNSEQSKFIGINLNEHEAEKRFEVRKGIDNLFEGLSSNFYGQLGNFKNYSEDLFLDLFFKEGV